MFSDIFSLVTLLVFICIAGELEAIRRLVSKHQEKSQVVTEAFECAIPSEFCIAPVCDKEKTENIAPTASLPLTALVSNASPTVDKICDKCGHKVVRYEEENGKVICKNCENGNI